MNKKQKFLLIFFAFFLIGAHSKISEKYSGIIPGTKYSEKRVYTSKDQLYASFRIFLTYGSATAILYFVLEDRPPKKS